MTSYTNARIIQWANGKVQKNRTKTWGMKRIDRISMNTDWIMLMMSNQNRGNSQNFSQKERDQNSLLWFLIQFLWDLFIFIYLFIWQRYKISVPFISFLPKTSIIALRFFFMLQLRESQNNYFIHTNIMKPCREIFTVW